MDMRLRIYFDILDRAATFSTSKAYKTLINGQRKTCPASDRARWMKLDPFTVKTTDRCDKPVADSTTPSLVAVGYLLRCASAAEAVRGMQRSYSHPYWCRSFVTSYDEQKKRQRYSLCPSQGMRMADLGQAKCGRSFSLTIPAIGPGPTNACSKASR